MSMTDTDGGLVVDLTAPQPGADGKAPSGDQGIADLKQQLDDANRRAREEADRNRDLMRRNEELQKTSADAQVETISASLAQITEKIAVLKAQYQEALETGDYAKVATLQVEITEAVATKKSLEHGKAAAEAGKTAAPAGGDRIENYISQFKDEPTRNWLRQHTDCITDQDKNALMIGAHWEAVGKHITPNSQEYFEFIESRVYGDGHEPGYQPSPPPPAARPTPTVAARPSREPAGGTGKLRPGQIHLTKEEVEMADLSGLTPAEYAANKAALTNDGLIGKNAPGADPWRR